MEECLMPNLRKHQRVLVVESPSFGNVLTFEVGIYCIWTVSLSRWWFQAFFIFTPTWLKPPTSYCLSIAIGLQWIAAEFR